MEPSVTEVRTGLFIDGEDRPGGDAFAVHDPADPDTVVGHAAAATGDEAQAAVRAAHAAFGDWSARPAAERGQLIVAALDGLEADHDDRAELLSRENGKVRGEADIDLHVMAGRFRLAAELADQVDAVRTLEGPPLRTTVARLPLGVVSVIVPYNWPLAILGASLPQALVAGNTTVVKAPPTTPLAFVQTLRHVAAALPPGVLNVVSGQDDVLGPVLIGDPLVKKVAFTGSVGAGRRIMGMAAESLTRVSLELGGNDPALVLADADLDEGAMHMLGIGAFLTTGQVCMAMKRLYVHRSRYDEVVDGLTAELEATRLGSGLDADATMGPLHTARQRDYVAELVEQARSQGAEVRERGEATPGADLDRGHFMHHSLVLDPPRDARVVAEEQFGPTLPIVPFDDEDEAIALANDSWSGLCSSVWSADPDHAAAVAARLRTGTTFVNAHNAPWLDDRAPFGGFDQSGMGREMGVEGVLAFTDTHSVSATVSE